MMFRPSQYCPYQEFPQDLSEVHHRVEPSSLPCCSSVFFLIVKPTFWEQTFTHEILLNPASVYDLHNERNLHSIFTFPYTVIFAFHETANHQFTYLKWLNALQQHIDKRNNLCLLKYNYTKFLSVKTP